MRNEDNSIFEIDSWLKWLQRAAYVGIGVFAVILIAYAIKFRAFNDGVKAISNIPDDWSAFGSLLSGASSLLGAVGTVGVMLLGIKQFKIQQEQIKLQQNQIKEQAVRQENLEREQSEIWRKQSNLLEQQLQKLDFENFNNNLKSIEEFADNKYKFNNKLFLYNSLNSIDKKLNINEYLIYELNRFNDKVKRPKDSIVTPEIEINELKWLFKKLSSVIYFSYNSDPITGDILCYKENIGINIIKLESSIAYLNQLLLALQYTLCFEKELPTISTDFIVDSNNIINIIDNNTHYQDLKIHGTFKGYNILLMFYLEVAKLPFKHSITELFSVNVSMDGIEDFKNNSYGKEFIRKTRSIIDKSKIDATLSRRLNQLINEFNSQY